MNKLLLVILLACSVSQIKAQSCSPATAYKYLDINDVKARVNNGGDMWWDLIGTAKYTVPQSSGVNSLFAGALWLGGLDENNQLHVAAQTYRQTGNDYFPGPLDNAGNVTNATCAQFDSMWQVYRSEIDAYLAAWANVGAGGTLPSSQIPHNILHWPAKNNPYNPIVGNQDLAPFFDNDGDGDYDPTKGDYPVLGQSGTCNGLATPDQMIWWVFNDKGNTHTETGGVPLGVEVRATAYAYQSSNAINDATFYRFNITNKSSHTYHNFYGALWVDPDLGCYLDDYIGCDSAYNMGIVYNADPTDGPCGTGGSYGNQPPLLGIKVLHGVSNDTSLRRMNNFMIYNNDFTAAGNPSADSNYYYFLQSKFKDGSHLMINGNGTQPTNYAFPSDPLNTSGWSACTTQSGASDQRMIISSGPATLAPGQSVTLEYAVVWVRPPVGYYAPCPSFDALKQAATTVQNFYNNCMPTAVNEVAVNQSRFKLFPNPTSATKSITVETTEAGKISVFDLSGRTLTEQNLTNTSSQLDVSKLVAGCYLIRFVSGQGVASYTKLIVQ